MADTTYEEARRCPKCQEPGQEVGERAIAANRRVTRGARIKIIACRNSRCKWFNETYLVQVNPDGTVPPPTLIREKQFRPLGVSTEQIQESLDRQLRAELEKGAEWYGR